MDRSRKASVIILTADAAIVGTGVMTDRGGIGGVLLGTGGRGG